MNSTTFGKIRVFPSRRLLDCSKRLPEAPGAYLFFARGGIELLTASAYFAYQGKRPQSLRGHVHLYTGAARNLRARVMQHLLSDVTSSSLRRTLLALQTELGAISASPTVHNEVAGEQSLTKWLSENSLFAVMADDSPFVLEHALLELHASPFNIVHRRNLKYARLLSVIRQVAFPSSCPHRHRTLRKK